jgi:hypothetical protein
MNQKGFITELDLNNKQITDCLKHSGTIFDTMSRFFKPRDAQIFKDRHYYNN